ncbi:MAG: hypothetical protein IKR59_00540 [Lachnospiraceae bacterium]|nr:hypothetical protein [Lachnospiraceae bacterium]
MKPVFIVLIVVGVIILASAVIHRRVIRSLIKFKFMPKAPKWHFWLPKKMRRS